MSSHALTEQDRRPYQGRHHKPEELVQPVEPPPWTTDERARPVRLVGEGPTQVLRVPTRLPELAMPLPARHPQRARWWNVRFSQLGVGLHALRRSR